MASQVALVVKNLLSNAGDIRDEGPIPGWEDPLEEGMAIHSNILAWRIPWTEEPGGYSPQGRQESETTEVTDRARMLFPLLLEAAAWGRGDGSWES